MLALHQTKTKRKQLNGKKTKSIRRITPLGPQPKNTNKLCLSPKRKATWPKTTEREPGPPQAQDHQAAKEESGPPQQPKKRMAQQGAEHGRGAAKDRRKERLETPPYLPHGPRARYLATKRKKAPATCQQLYTKNNQKGKTSSWARLCIFDSPYMPAATSRKEKKEKPRQTSYTIGLASSSADFHPKGTTKATHKPRPATKAPYPAF